MNTPRRWTLRRVVFLLLVYALIVAAAEAAIRVINPVTGRPAYYGYPEGLIVPDPVVGHRYRPGFRGFFASPRYRDIPIAINREGFRDREWAEPDPARPRVMTLGDSIAFGSPLRAEERFTEQAAAVLTGQGRPIETCNCGVNGFGVEQYDLLLRAWGPQLKPRLVLIGLCLNDAEPLNALDDAKLREAEEAKKRLGKERRKELLKRWRLDFDKSYLWNFLRAGLEEMKWRSPRYAPLMAERYARKTRQNLEGLYRDGSGLTRLETHFVAMREFAAALGAGFGVVVFPYQHQLYEADPWVVRRATELLARLGIPYVDLHPRFLPLRDRGDLYAYQDDCHPTALGHRIAGEAAAELVAAELARQTALTPPPLPSDGRGALPFDPAAAGR